MRDKTVYLRMQSDNGDLHRGSEQALAVASRFADPFLHLAGAYVAKCVRRHCACAPSSGFYRHFSYRSRIAKKNLDSIKRPVRLRSSRLHPIRAATLFTNSACLRRQIFIPYAPISRSVGAEQADRKTAAASRGILKEMRTIPMSEAAVKGAGRWGHVERIRTGAVEAITLHSVKPGDCMTRQEILETSCWSRVDPLRQPLQLNY